MTKGGVVSRLLIKEIFFPWTGVFHVEEAAQRLSHRLVGRAVAGSRTGTVDLRKTSIIGTTERELIAFFSSFTNS